MHYIKAHSFNCREFYDPTTRRMMILKRPIHILLVRGDHGDAAFTCEEFMIGGEYMWDDPETERSFVRELFNAYDSPDVYKYDNYVQFRALIKEVQRIPVM